MCPALLTASSPRAWPEPKPARRISSAWKQEEPNNRFHLIISTAAEDPFGPPCIGAITCRQCCISGRGTYTRLYAHAYRENGRFGSHPSHDGFADDSGPE